MEKLFTFIANHPFLVGAFVIIFALFVRNEIRRSGKQVTAQELVNLMNRDQATVLDVRDANDYSQGHIVNSMNIPYAALARRIDELDKYKEKPLVIACKMGQQSGAAGTMLRKAGFQNVARLRGGLTEWRSLNMPVVRG